MSTAGSFTLATPLWLGPAVAFLVVGTAALVWGYYRSAGRGVGWMRVTAFAFKWLGLALVALCLVEPSWATRHAKPGANQFVVLADNSKGLSIHDRGNAHSRGEILRAAVAPGTATGAPWLQHLGDNFQVRRYLFDARVSRSQDFSDLTFDGEASALGTALRTTAERYRGSALAGIFVLSDGNATDIGDEPFDGAGLPPVYPVLIGGPKPEADIAVTNVTVTQTAFEDAPVTILADIDAAGFAGQPLTAELVDVAGKVLQTQSLRVTQDDETLTTRFRLRPEKTGIGFYRIKITTAAATKEATLANNNRLVMVDGKRGPYRVLYVSGRPNWELKFLRRALESDTEVQLVALIRIARREPKFAFRARGQQDEASNPLFQGFGNKDPDQTERYDQPVVIRLGTRDASELRDGFPKSAEPLFEYHALVLDDVEAAFFSADQLALIERFVTERGGGFLMLGGAESFHSGQYDRTPVGQILPVYLDRLPAPPPVASLHLQLSRDGWLAPWARLRDNERDEQTRLAAMPGFQVLNNVGAAKPAATILATVSTGTGSPFPALVVQRAGNGRAGAIPIGDLWRWGLKHPDMQEDLGKFWRQTVRWLVSDVPERVAVRVERAPAESGGAVSIRVRVRDRSYAPADDASVAVEVTGPDGRKSVLPAEPSASESGLYTVSYVAHAPGGYRVGAQVSEGGGAGEAGFVLDLDAEEHRSLRANPAFMQTLAARTGGRVVELGKLDAFVRDLPRLNAPVAETRIRPLWDSWLVFLLALLCFVAEWTLRRWRGMA